MLQVNNISKRYKSIQALDHVNLRIGKGKVVGLLGVSGSGKSTFMKMVAGIIEPQSGQILVEDSPISQETKAITSILTESNSFPKWMTLQEAIRFYELMFKDFNVGKFDSWMVVMQLDKFRAQRIRSLSKGMQQKFRLALALSRDAKLFLLDEPLGGIDPLAREDILEMLAQQIDSETTMVITTHLISEIEGLLEQVVFIDQGKIIGSFDCEEVRINEGKSIEKLYKEVLRNARSTAI